MAERGLDPTVEEDGETWTIVTHQFVTLGEVFTVRALLRRIRVAEP